MAKSEEGPDQDSIVSNSHTSHSINAYSISFRNQSLPSDHSLRVKLLRSRVR